METVNDGECIFVRINIKYGTWQCSKCKTNWIFEKGSTGKNGRYKCPYCDKKIVSEKTV